MAYHDSKYKTLPGNLTDYIAESMCGILDTKQPPKCYNWSSVPLPELVFFVEKVTAKAKIEFQTAIAVLILGSRLKERLPKNAHGKYGTCHKIFLSALLVALKELSQQQQQQQQQQQEDDVYDDDDDDDDRPYSSAPPTCCSSPIPDDTDDEGLQGLPLSLLPSREDQPSSNILSTTPSSTTSSTSLSMSDDEEDLLSTTPPQHQHHHHHHHIYKPRYSMVNRRLAEISGVYSLQEINHMEREFRKLLGYHNTWVNEKDIRDFVENNKYELGLI